MSMLRGFRKWKKVGTTVAEKLECLQWIKELQKETKVTNGKYAGRITFFQVNVMWYYKGTTCCSSNMKQIKKFVKNIRPHFRITLKEGYSTKMNNNKILFNSKNLVTASLSSLQRQKTKLAENITWCCFEM